MMPPLVSRARSTLAPVALTLFLAGCASGGGAPGSTGLSYPQLAGEWGGSITIEGQTLPGTLKLSQNGPDLEGTFRAPDLDLVTQGTGTVLPDGSVAMTLEYNLQCPGTATMTGDLSTDGAELSGRLLASDCTGDSSGSFRFRR